jgi:hypothetical protein
VAVVVGFDQGNKVLLASMDGALNEETLGELTAEVGRLSRSQTPDAILVDLSGVTSFGISNEVIRFLARSPSPLAKEVVRVIVAPQRHIYGVTRMFQSYADGNRPNVNVVRSLEEAYRYLGSPLAGRETFVEG